MNADGDDIVFFGTPIAREEDLTSRKKKAVAESVGQLRSLAPWQQEVRDEEGRRRFHGAFTGGFSAGYYNTVGSKEGWTPQSFTSSRKNRAEVKKQDILNFLDDDEKAELEARSLGTSSQFDTFGFTAGEIARKQAEKEQQQQRPSAIPGPVPDELILPITESIGVKLLLKMGWRHGNAIRDSQTNSMYDAMREAREAFVPSSSKDAKSYPSNSDDALNDTPGDLGLPPDTDTCAQRSVPVYVLNPKQDLYGLGYDPFKNAPEFRGKKISYLSSSREQGFARRSSGSSFVASKSGKIAPGFGIGALEELDVEDEDVYASGLDFGENYVQDTEEMLSSSVSKSKELVGKKYECLPGFRAASHQAYSTKRFDPPNVPKDFVPKHKFSAPLETGSWYADIGPPEAPPPEENTKKVLIDGVSSLVARCGKLFEDLSREKNRSNPLFSFLVGGDGQDYYARRLWEEQQKRASLKNHQDMERKPAREKLTAESRGRIFGEKPLERSSKNKDPSINIQLQYNLGDTFIKPMVHNEFREVVKPFEGDLEKQERFEHFLKEKYEGGLRSSGFSGSKNMSEVDRAREKLDFEAAAEAMEKGKWVGERNLSGQHFVALPKVEFTSVLQAEQTVVENVYPKREEFQWQPAPVLCKRFDIIDPYMGKPLPPPRVRGKIDSLIFTPEPAKLAESKTTGDGKTEPPLSNVEKGSEETEAKAEVETIERPVDLYKAIFSDDSEDEEQNPSTANDSERKTEAASAALNRLVAGDFLESLGKELGLEVPPERSPLINGQNDPVPQNPEPCGSFGKYKAHEVVYKEIKSSASEHERGRKHSRRHSYGDDDDSDDYRGRKHSRSRRESERSGRREDSKHRRHRRRDW